MSTATKQLSVRKSFQVILVGLFLLSSLFAGSNVNVSAQDSSSDLFSEQLSGSPQMDISAEPFVLRSRFLSVNLDLLLDAKGKARGADQLPQVSLNIFPDARFTGVVDKVQKTGDSVSWTGSLADVEGGYFYLVVNEGVFIAHVASPQGVFEVSSVGDGVYQAIEIDQSVLVDDPPAVVPVGKYPAADDLSLATAADTGATLDVMVVYTPAALAGEGGNLAALKARIALAVTETNTSYANAGITTRLRLVHTEQITYSESGNIATDVSRLAGTSDGYMDSVHALRNMFGADMVSLVVENGGGYCGMADAIMASAATAFQVTARSGCMTGYYSFGHEFGHLQGARHDVYVDSSTTPYTFGHGYVHTGTTAANRWRTVMAYNNKCSDLGYNCTRLQYWSNASKTYNSAAMGNSTAQNYAVLNLTDTTVANFRTAVIGANFSNSFNGSSSGWSAVKGTWGLASSAYYRSLGLANNGASAKHTGKYGDITYTVKMKRSGTCVTCSNRLFIRGNPASLVSTNWWKPSYVFQYANDGSFSVYEVTTGGTITTLKAWTASSAIVKNGWNTLKVVAVGPMLKFYINNILVWNGADNSLLTGTVGFGFYRDAAAGTLDVDSVSLSTTPTADLNPAADVLVGDELPGGTFDNSPSLP